MSGLLADALAAGVGVVLSMLLFFLVVDMLGVLDDVEGVVFSMTTSFFAKSLTLGFFGVLIVAPALAERGPIEAEVSTVAGD